MLFWFAFETMFFVDLIPTSHINISSVHQKIFITFRWSWQEIKHNTLNCMAAVFEITTIRLFINSLQRSRFWRSLIYEGKLGWWYNIILQNVLLEFGGIVQYFGNVLIRLSKWKMVAKPKQYLVSFFMLCWTTLYIFVITIIIIVNKPVFDNHLGCVVSLLRYQTIYL